MVLSIGLQYKLDVVVVDIVKAFMTAGLKETVLSNMYPGYTTGKKWAPFGDDTKLLYLMAAYGLRQSSHNFGEEYAGNFVARGYKRLISDVSVFVRRHMGQLIIFTLWVDDNIVLYSSKEMLDHYYETLKLAGYEYTVDPFNYILGMNVDYDKEKGTMAFSAETFLNRFFKINELQDLPVRGVPAALSEFVTREDCPNTMRPDMALYTKFRRLLGGIAHVSSWVHDELRYSVSVISQYMNNPSEKHLSYLMRMAGYLKGVVKHAKVFRRALGFEAGTAYNGVVSLWGYCDADYAGCRDTRRSRTGYCVYVLGNVVGSMARLQASVALSTAEAEFMALVSAMTFMVWAKSLIEELGFEVQKQVPLYSDNKSCITIAKNAQINFKYSKHIDVRYMYIKSMIGTGNPFDVIFCKGTANPSDLFTKPKAQQKFRQFRDAIKGRIVNVVEPEMEVDMRLSDMMAEQTNE